MSSCEQIVALASSHGGKVFHVVRSSFADSVDTFLKAYLTRLIHVCMAHVIQRVCILVNATVVVAFIRTKNGWYKTEPCVPMPLVQGWLPSANCKWSHSHQVPEEESHFFPYQLFRTGQL